MRNTGNKTYREMLRELGNPSVIVHGGVWFVVDYEREELRPDGKWLEGRPDFNTIPFCLAPEFPQASDEIFAAIRRAGFTIEIQESTPGHWVWDSVSHPEGHNVINSSGWFETASEAAADASKLLEHIEQFGWA